MAHKKWSYIKNNHNRKCHTVVQGSLGTKDQGFWFKYHYELVEFYVFQCIAIFFSDFKLYHFWSVGVRSSWLLCHFDMTSVVSNSSLAFRHKMPLVYLPHFLPTFISHCSGGLDSF